MADTVAAAGVPRELASAAIAHVEADPVYLAARKHQQLLRKLESVVGNLQKVWELSPGYKTVDKRPLCGMDEFLERYAVGCRPVVFTDAAQDWPARSRWSPADLKARFGHLDVEIQAERSADARYEENKLAHRKSVRLGSLVDRVLAGGATNDYCPAGAVTPLHHDSIMLCHTQIVGRKRWRFISPLQWPHLYNFSGVFSPIDIDQPDLGRYPAHANATVLEGVVEPGETVFLPLAWWHQVTSLDVSLSFSYSNIAVPNQYSYNDPSITNW